jgi:hypothetical protein
MSKENSNPQDDMTDLVMGGSEDYFEELEKQVNPAIYDDKPQTEEQVTPEAESNTQDSMEGSGATANWESDDNPYKKRYSDSTRENSKNQKMLEENQQYSALIDIMKKDAGLIDHVRGYLETGGGKKKPSLPEDFIFDADEAIHDPTSVSGQVFKNAVKNVVSQEVQKTEANLNNRIDTEKKQVEDRDAAIKWMKDNDMSEEEFLDMLNKAGEHTITYDDMNLIINKDKVKNKVAKNTKQDVINQMKNVRKNPQTVSGTGSADVEDITTEDKVFNVIKGLEDDDLFG